MSTPAAADDVKEIINDFFKEENIPEPKPEDKQEEKIEQKTEEKKEDENEDPPIFKRGEEKKEQQKQKKTPEESIADLRKQRDEERSKNKIYTETFGDHDVKVIKPLLDLVTEVTEGPLTENTIKQIIDDIKTKDETINELKSQLEQQEKVVNDLDVRYSDQFKNKFQKPYQEAAETLFLEFATVDDDKKVIGPKSTKEFNDYLLGLTEINGIEVKAELQKFMKNFKQETGEDASVSNMNSLMSSVRSFHKSKNDLNEAYTNWKTKKTEAEKSAAIQSEAEREVLHKKLRRERVRLSSVAFQNFDFDELDFVDEKKVEEFFQEEFKLGEKLQKGEEIPSYDVLLRRGVNARLWEEWAPRIKELLELEKRVEKGDRNDLPGNNRTTKKPGEEKDWLDL